jgi:hypothetical protein
MNMRSRIGSLIHVVALAGVLVFSFTPKRCLAQSSTTQQNPVNASVPSPATQTFGGLTLGVGLALSENLQAQHRVTSATVVNGIVRVTQTNDASAGIVLESHYFFVPTRTSLFGLVPPGDWGHGPFVAIEAGSGGNNVVTAFALGLDDWAPSADVGPDDEHCEIFLDGELELWHRASHRPECASSRRRHNGECTVAPRRIRLACSSEN